MDEEQLRYRIVLIAGAGFRTVKSCYNCLQDSVKSCTTEPELRTTLCKLWKTSVLSKINVFGWRLLFDMTDYLRVMC
jgi:hypothetical protein